MPFTLPGKRNTIGKQIEEHLLKGRNSSSVKTSSQTATTILVVAAENISLGVAVAIDGTGQLIKAGIVPAIGISVSAGNSGTSIVVSINNVAIIPDVTFEINKEVWLKNGTPNMSTELPDIESSSFIQSLGTAISINKLLIEIKSPKYIE